MPMHAPATGRVMRIALAPSARGDLAPAIYISPHPGADLVVIGRGHTHAPLSRLRTNAYAIVREAPCPVLSL